MLIYALRPGRPVQSTIIPASLGGNISSHATINARILFETELASVVHVADMFLWSNSRPVACFFCFLLFLCYYQRPTFSALGHRQLSGSCLCQCPPSSCHARSCLSCAISARYPLTPSPLTHSPPHPLTPHPSPPQPSPPQPSPLTPSTPHPFTPHPLTLSPSPPHPLAPHPSPPQPLTPSPLTPSPPSMCRYMNCTVVRAALSLFV